MNYKKRWLCVGLVTLALVAIIYQFLYSDKRLKYHHLILAPMMPAAPPKPSVSISQFAIKPDMSITQQHRVSKIKAWVLQLASFREEKNAMNLRNKLQHQNITAYVQARKISPKDYKYQVMAGPFITQTEAESFSKQIAKQFKLRGIVKGFNPVVETASG